MNTPPNRMPNTGAAALLRAAALLLVFLLLAPVSVTAQQAPAGFELGLFELRVARIGASTEMALLGEDGRVLVPVVRVLELTGLPVSRSAGDSMLSVPRLGSRGTATLDLARRELRAETTTSLDSTELAIVEGTAYLHAERLAEFLQAEVQVDVGMLVVSFARTPPFPAEQEALLAARRTRLAEVAERRIEGAGAPVPYPARSGGGVLEWSVSTTGRDPLGQASARAELGLALLGGDATVGFGYIPAGDQVLADGRWSYRRGFPTSQLIRQLEMGNIALGGALGRPASGVRIGNAEFVRGPFFAPVTISPEVPSGWEYEVYQDGQLLGYSDGSRSGISVPIRYGSTPVQVKLYSPAGEMVVADVLYQMPMTQLPPGRFEYSAGYGRCAERSGCRTIGSLSTSYGAARWLTLGAGADLLSDSTSSELRPYASLNSATLAGWSAQFQVAHHSFVRGNLGYYGKGRFSGTVGAGITEPESAQPNFLPSLGRRWHTDGSFGVRGLSGFGVFRSLRVDARAEGAAGQAPEWWRSAGRFELARGSVELRHERERGRTSGLWGISVLALTPAWVPAWFGNQAVTLGAGWSADGRRETALGAGARVGAAGYLNLAARWQNELGRAALMLSYSSTLRGARLYARAQAIGTAPPSVTTSATGALSVGREVGLAPLPYGGIGNAGVSGVIFRDLNGNGARDADEPAVEDVPVLVGGYGVRTDSAGRYHAWNILPFQVAEVRVDTARALDPSWVPLHPSVKIRPTPHLYNRVDLPLVQTREVVGRLEAMEGVATVGGVTIEVREVESGAVQTAVTFSDGEFYLSRLRPGRYELRVAVSSLGALRATADPEPLAFTLAGGEEPLMELPPITLRPAAP